jgi:hypothetical protein|tara:strand:- start:11974 stop:12600 length:627 start_codon:yes stop_codon:yes gene_type:complete
MMNKKYLFIHPTKTGGTSVEQFFLNNYSRCIEGSGHQNRCADSERPIIIFRNPYDRFSSMFRYWKFGSNLFQHSEKELNKRSQFNINDFARLIKNNNTKMLHSRWLRKVHFIPQSHWFNCDYSKIIVIEYCWDLQASIYKLLRLLNIENKNIKLRAVNKTQKTIVDGEFNNETTEWFGEYFKEDLNIFRKIQENSHSFKELIKCSSND